MLSYAGETAARKRAEPGDDIASALVQAEVDGVGLTDAQLQWFFLLLVNAGGDTTRNLLAAGIQQLFDHPDERARLQADVDGLLATAVEEMLRYTSPVVHFRRTAMEDTVVHDQPIKAGDKLMVFYGSGNRDEDVFDDPDRFDVGRDPNPHMAFGGGGPHLCLGLHVARIEIAVMLRELLTRLPDLAPAGDPEPLASNFITGVRTMPVEFTPGHASADAGRCPDCPAPIGPRSKRPATGVSGTRRSRGRTPRSGRSCRRGGGRRSPPRRRPRRTGGSGRSCSSTVPTTSA